MRQRLIRAPWQTAVAVILCFPMAGCSSSNPNGPSPGGGFEPEQFLRPGEYRLLAISTTQQGANCSGAQTQNPLMFALAAVVNVTRDGETWTARAKTEADGDVELRLRRVGEDTVAGSRVLIITVEGTGRGSAAAIGSGMMQTLSFVGESRLEGRALFQGAAQGTATGTIRVNSPIFGSFECPAVSWSLVPATSPF
jgi:hypothetical protein